MGYGCRVQGRGRKGMIRFPIKIDRVDMSTSPTYFNLRPRLRNPSREPSEIRSMIAVLTGP